MKSRQYPSFLVMIANYITLFRLVLTVVVVWSLEASLFVVALFAFILAAISDWLDGYLARKLKQESALGALLDPLADKILVLAVFVFFSFLGLIPVWVTIIIMTRELLVTGIRQMAMSQGVVMAADKSGKYKTTIQMLTLILGLVQLAYNLDVLKLYFEIGVWLSLALTLYSGVFYCWISRGMFKRV